MRKQLIASLVSFVLVHPVVAASADYQPPETEIKDTVAGLVVDAGGDVSTYGSGFAAWKEYDGVYVIGLTEFEGFPVVFASAWPTDLSAPPVTCSPYFGFALTGDKDGGQMIPIYVVCKTTTGEPALPPVIFSLLVVPMQ